MSNSISSNGAKSGIVNLKKAILSCILSIFFIGYGCYFIYISEFIGAITFMLLGFIFCYQLIINCMTVTISKEGVTRYFIKKPKDHLDWKNISEIGLIGEKVFTRNPKRTGDKYIYFSTKPMTEDERFNMIVKWPPKTADILYVEYSQTLLEKAQFYSKQNFKTYNVRDLYPNSELQEKANSFLEGESDDFYAMEELQLNDSIAKQLNDTDNIQRKGFL
jgi:hypothetical protein